MNLLRCSASSAYKTIFSMQWLGNLLQRPAQFVATRGHRSLTNGPTRAVLQLERVGASKRASSPTGIQSSTLPAPNQALQLLSAAHSCRHRFFTSESSHLSAEKMPRSDNAREAQELISCLYKDGQAPKVALCATGGAAQGTFDSNQSLFERKGVCVMREVHMKTNISILGLDMNKTFLHL